jgi:hypothetical protein
LKVKSKDNNFLCFKTIKRFFNGSVVSFRNFTIVSTAVFFFIFGAYSYRNNAIQFFLSTSLTIFAYPYNFIKSNSEYVDTFNISIPFSNYQKLSLLRDKALERNTLRGLRNKYVKAKYNDDIKIKIRLKGGVASDHLSGEKWSFRIKVQGNNRIYGMKNFSLMDPKRRGFMHTWFLRKVMKHEGLISKRYKFVELSINSDSKGIYAMDEHLDTVMLENNNKKDSVIIRFMQEPLFYEKTAWNRGPSGNDDYYYSMDIGTFSNFKIDSSDYHKDMYDRATSLLDGFRKGDLSVSEVFNTKSLSKWFAVTDVLGAWHGFSFNNMRFYYNPIDGKLEPVPDDHYNETQGRVDTSRIFRLNDNYNKGKFLSSLFDDMDFTEMYLKELNRVTKKEYIDNLWNEFEGEINSTVNILRKDYFNFNFDRESYDSKGTIERLISIGKIGKKEFYRNQEVLRDILDIYKGVHANFNRVQNGYIWLDMASTKSIPMEILSLSIKGVSFYPEKGRAILRGKKELKPMEYQPIVFKVDSKINNENIKHDEINVMYRVLGSDKVKEASVSQYSSFSMQQWDDSFLENKSNFIDYDFAELDGNIINIERGTHVLSSDFIIPKGYELNIEPGTTIDLNNNSAIISHSPIISVGNKNNKIQFVSSDGTGQGVVIIDSPNKSLLSNVVFKGLSKISRKGFGMTAPVVFYKSSVYMEDVSFYNNKSGDDYLNIIHSSYFIKDSLFENTVSDALDSDFSNGKIINTVFNNIGVVNNSGGDAIDLSGSSVVIDNVHINNVNDKGISFGEGSIGDLKGVKISSASIAIAVKDSSYVTIKDLLVSKSNIGLALFNKKKEYDGGEINAENVNFTGVSHKYLLEEKSRLVIDSNEYKSNSDNLKATLYK